MSENQNPRDLTPEQQKLFEQAMADADMGTKIADMIFRKGGDNENEAHLTEDEWCMVMMALRDVIDLVTGEVDSDYIEDCYEDSIQGLKDLRAKILAVEVFDPSPIYVSELDFHRLKAGKESVIDFVERQQTTRDLEKLVKREHKLNEENKK